MNLALLAIVLAPARRVGRPSATEVDATRSQFADGQRQVNHTEETPHPFQWSQLESADYPTYIANLRGIGCPEQTIREILAADVADSFASRREPLLAKIAGGGGTPVERNQAESALGRLRGEEAAILRRLFGLPDSLDSTAPSPTQTAVSSPPFRPHRPVVEDPTVNMPLVFQPVDAGTVKLAPDELQTIDEVRQSFVTALGTNQDVNSPEYLRRWQVAQNQADNLLNGFLGRQAVLQYEAALESQNQNSTSASTAVEN